jgi:predicted MFS family arabinose efflux permease
VPEPSGARRRDELVEGLRYVFSQPYLRVLTVWTSVWNLFNSAFFALMIVYFVRVLHWGPTKIGLLTGLSTSGFLLGAFVNRRVVARLGIGRLIAYSGILSSVSLFGIPGAPLSHPAPVIVVTSIVGTLLGFFANVNQLTFRQSITPPRLLGRMNSVVRFMYWGTIPLGSALGGLLAGPLGLRATMLAACAGSVVACIPIATSKIRTLHEAPEPLLEPLAALPSQ